jgi:beta-galactosidase
VDAVGYFINSMFDYRGDYASFLSGYDENNIYKIGLIDEDRKTEHLSFKVIKSKLQNTERVTIPIGSKRDKAPVIFIVIGLGLALIIGVLVNSGRKFREDISRALFRPYNFFADIRDQRIISSYHSTLMAIVIAVVMGLMVSSVLYFLRDNIVFERIILSFGSVWLTGIISCLAWNPIATILWLSISFCVLTILLILVIKFASLFIKNRVYLSSIYFAVVWAFLPFVLLIPVGIILYRLLAANVANVYIYIALILFAVWVFYRLMKGIYVIFDIASGSVYLYSIIIVVFILTSAVLYYDFKNSLIDYLLLTLRQYKIF